MPGMGLCQRGVHPCGKTPPEHRPGQAMRPGHPWDPWSSTQHPTLPSREPPLLSPSAAPKPAPRRCTQRWALPAAIPAAGKKGAKSIFVHKVVGDPQLPLPFAEGKGEMVADDFFFLFPFCFEEPCCK